MPRPDALRFIAAPPPVDPPSWTERRSDQRHGVFTIARVRPARGRPISVGVHDLSVTGCRIATDLFREGEIVWIAVPPLAPVLARVKWRRTGLAGLKFDQPLHRSVLAHLVRMHAPLTLQTEAGRRQWMDLRRWAEAERTPN